MSKFIELTYKYVTHGDHKFFINTDFIEVVQRHESFPNNAEVYIRGKKSVTVKESYEEVVNLIKYAPEVADIMRDNHE